MGVEANVLALGLTQAEHFLQCSERRDSKTLHYFPGCNGCLDICNKLVPRGSSLYIAYGMSDYACSNDAESDFP